MSNKSCADSNANSFEVVPVKLQLVAYSPDNFIRFVEWAYDFKKTLEHANISEEQKYFCRQIITCGRCGND